MEKTKIKRGLWQTYFLFFVATFLICSIVIIFSFYIYVEGLLKEETASSSINIANQVKDVMDIRMEELYSIAVQLSLDRRISNLFNVAQPFEGSVFISMNQARELVGQYSAINNFVDYFAIYYPNSEYVFTPMGSYSADYFFNKILIYENMDNGKLYDMLDKFHHRDIIPLSEISGQLLNGEYITYIQSLPIESKTPKANVFMFISEEKLLSMMAKTMPEHVGYVNIITKDGKIIASKNHDMLSNSKSIEKILALDTPFFMEEEGENRSMIAYAPSNVTDWCYIAVLNMNIMLDKIAQIRNRTLVIALIGCGVGFILSVFMTKNAYKPWESLMQSLPNSINEDHINKGYNNEYLYIKETIKSVLTERESFKTAFENSRGYARYYIIQNLCKGKGVSNEDIKCNRIEFPYDRYRILSIKSNENVENMYDNFPTIIARLENIGINGCKIYGYYDQRDFLCLIVNIEPQWEEQSAFNILIENIKQEIEEHVTGHIFIGASDFCNDISLLPYSFQQAKKALEHSFVGDENLVVEYNNLQNMTIEYPELSIDSERQLINCVRNGDYVSASTILDSVFSDLMNKQNISMFDVYYIYYNSINVVLQVCNEKHINLDEIYNTNIDNIFNINEYSSIEQIINTIYDIYLQTCHYIEKNDDSQIGLSRKIEEYIDEHFANTNISLACMADDLGMSPSYLSRYMSKNFGMGFGDYLNDIRITEAKLLLTNDSRPIYEIAEIIGYTNVNTFIRVFKRLEGITPGQYRENIS